MTRAPRGLWVAAPLLGAAALLVATAVAAAFSGLRVAEVETSDPQPVPTGDTAGQLPAWPTAFPFAPPADDSGGGGLPWLGDLLLVLWLAAVVAALVLLLWVLARRGWRRRGATPVLRTLRRPQTRTTVKADSEQLVAALDAGLVALSDDDRDPRRAVIACWVRLEEAAVAAGVPRYDTDTAGELVLRLLRDRRVSEPALAALAEVYRLARYATHHVDEQMRTLARSALRRLRQELLAPVQRGDVPGEGAGSSAPQRGASWEGSA